jgi:hypothetical protein
MWYRYLCYGCDSTHAYRSMEAAESALRRIASAAGYRDESQMGAFGAAHSPRLIIARSRACALMADISLAGGTGWHYAAPAEAGEGD